MTKKYQEKYELTVRGNHVSWHRTESGLERAARRHDRSTAGTLLWSSLRYLVDGELRAVGHLNHNGDGIEWDYSVANA